MPRFRDGRVGCDSMTSCDGNIVANETAAEKAHWRIVRTRIAEGREHVEYTCDACVAGQPVRSAREAAGADSPRT